MMSYRSIKELPLQGSKVLVRVDFNVPMEGDKILDNSRISAAMPTIQYLLSQKCALILMSHLGRPKGRDQKLSLKPVAEELSKLLGRPIKMANDSVGHSVEQAVEKLKEGEILLLENLRFYEAEEAPDKDPQFAKKLASLADFYVNDAFGCAHRAHASIVEVPRLLLNKSGTGFLLEREILFFKDALKNPKRPFLAILGGAKVSTKIKVLKSLIAIVDELAIAGGMAFTFLKALGKNVGDSLIEPDYIDMAKEIIKKAESAQIKLYLPSDFIIAKDLNDSNPTISSIDQGIPKGLSGFDIGPKTINSFIEAIKRSETILWNGPVGVFEKKAFSKGTEEICKALGRSDAITIVGGGETVAAVNEFLTEGHITHLSTGGGAALEFIENGTLPGIEILQK